MDKKRLLVLTDHDSHSEENSIYVLLNEMRRHPACGQIDVASRGIEQNRSFFEKMESQNLLGSPVGDNFQFYVDGRSFKNGLSPLDLEVYDFVFMRLPNPVPVGFWAFLEKEIPQAKFVNRPTGIGLTGSKDFLLNFPKVSPPMKRCQTLEEIDEFRQQFSIVLKPMRSHGGKGILRIDGDAVISANGERKSWNEFAQEMSGKDFDFLSVKFLKNVGQGDKRIIVCNGKIVGASLRKPAPGNWMCNISQGGSSHADQADEDEQAIVAHIDPILRKHGILFYGVDTLVGDGNRRLLSEINTASIGGVKAIEEYAGKPIARQVSNLIWDYFLKP